MPPIIATFLCLAGIAGLFILDRERTAKFSWALLLPFAWISLCASRSISQWLTRVESTSVDQLTDGNPPDASVAALLVLMAVAVLIGRRARLMAVLRGMVPLVAFFLFCAISFMWSDYPLVTFKRCFKAFGDISMILVIATDAFPFLAVKRVFGRLGFVLVPTSILLVRYYPSLGRTYSSWTGQAFNMGVATGKNSLGILCLMCGLASFWCFLEALREKQDNMLRRLLAHGVVLLMVIYLFRIAHSATAFGCFAVGCLLILLAECRWFAHNPVLVHAVVAGTTLSVLYVVLLDPGIGVLNAIGRDATLTGRTALWSQVLSVPVNPVWGAGYESFWLGERLQHMWRINPELPTQAHSGYIELYVDLGWAGLILAGIFMFFAYRSITRGLRTNQRLPALLLAYFVVAVIYNLTEHGFREMHPVWIMLVLSGTALCIFESHGLSDFEATRQSDDRVPTRVPTLVRPVAVSPARRQSVSEEYGSRQVLDLLGVPITRAKPRSASQTDASHSPQVGH